MRPNHLGYPADNVKINAEASLSQLPHGSRDWHQCEDSSMLVTEWKDKHIVYYLSTACAPHEEEPQCVTQRQRDGTETEPPVLLLWLPMPST